MSRFVISIHRGAPLADSMLVFPNNWQCQLAVNCLTVATHVRPRILASRQWVQQTSARDAPPPRPRSYPYRSEPLSLPKRSIPGVAYTLVTHWFFDLSPADPQLTKGVPEAWQATNAK